MLVTKKTHETKVNELEKQIAILQEYNRARDAIIGEMAAERVTAYMLFRECLTLLQDIDTKRTGGALLRMKINGIVEQARELGILDAEEEEGQDATD